MFPNIRRLQEQNPVQYQPSSITNKKLIVFCERTSGYIALPVWKLINLVYLLFYILFQCDSILPATLCYFHNISYSQLRMKSFMISIIFVEKVNTEFRQRKTAGIPLSSVIFLYARICCLIRFPYLDIILSWWNIFFLDIFLLPWCNIFYLDIILSPWSNIFSPWYLFTAVMEHFLPIILLPWSNIFSPWYLFATVIKHFLVLISFYCRDGTFSTLISLYCRDGTFSTLISLYYRDGKFSTLIDIIVLP